MRRCCILLLLLLPEEEAYRLGSLGANQVEKDAAWRATTRAIRQQQAALRLDLLCFLEKGKGLFWTQFLDHFAQQLQWLWLAFAKMLGDDLLLCWLP